MRNAILALLAALPVAAVAQTPRDIAHQLWPQGAPASVSTAPEPGTASAGAASPRDLARLTWPSGAPQSGGSAKRDGSAYAGSFTGADLVRLRGTENSEPAPVVANGPYQTALKEVPHG